MCGTVQIIETPSQQYPGRAKCTVSSSMTPNGFYAVILNQSDPLHSDPHDMPRPNKEPKYYRITEVQTEYGENGIVYIIDGIPDRSGVQSGYKQVAIWAVWYSHGTSGYYAS